MATVREEEGKYDAESALSEEVSLNASCLRDDLSGDSSTTPEEGLLSVQERDREGFKNFPGFVMSSSPPSATSLGKMDSKYSPEPPLCSAESGPLDTNDHHYQHHHRDHHYHHHKKKKHRDRDRGHHKKHRHRDKDRSSDARLSWRVENGSSGNCTPEHNQEERSYTPPVSSDVRMSSKRRRTSSDDGGSSRSLSVTPPRCPASPAPINNLRESRVPCIPHRMGIISPSGSPQSPPPVPPTSLCNSYSVAPKTPPLTRPGCIPPPRSPGPMSPCMSPGTNSRSPRAYPSHPFSFHSSVENSFPSRRYSGSSSPLHTRSGDAFYMPVIPSHGNTSNSSHSPRSPGTPPPPPISPDIPPPPPMSPEIPPLPPVEDTSQESLLNEMTHSPSNSVSDAFSFKCLTDERCERELPPPPLPPSPPPASPGTPPPLPVSPETPPLPPSSPGTPPLLLSPGGSFQKNAFNISTTLKRSLSGLSPRGFSPSSPKESQDNCIGSISDTFMEVNDSSLQDDNLERDTPSPLPDCSLECPKSPSPQFGSPSSSRSPSPSPLPAHRSRSPPLTPVVPLNQPLRLIDPPNTSPAAVLTKVDIMSPRVPIPDILSPTNSIKTDIMSPPHQSPRQGILSPPHHSKSKLVSPPSASCPKSPKVKSPPRTRPRSPMDLPVPKWKPDPIVRQKRSSESRTSVSSISSISSLTEIIVPVTPRPVTIPPTAEKLRRFSEEERLNMRERSASGEGHDTAESGFDDGSDLSPDHKPEVCVKAESVENKSLYGIEREPVKEEQTEANVEVPKLDFKSAVLDELSKFAEEGDTSIYTGPQGKARKLKDEMECREVKEEDQIVSPSKGESYIKTTTLRKPPTSSKKTESPKTSEQLLSATAPKKEEPESAFSFNSVTSIKGESNGSPKKALDFCNKEREIKVEEKVLLPVDSVKHPVNGTKVTDLLSKSKVNEVKNCKNDVDTSLAPENSGKMEYQTDHDLSKIRNNSASSRHKSSSVSSTGSKKYDCAKCYKRSKIKRYNIGVQCRRDKSESKSCDAKSTSSSVSHPTFSSQPYFAKVDFGTKHISLPRPPSNGKPGLEKYKYGQYMHVETYANGDATVVHMYQDEINHLSREEQEELAVEFLDVSFTFVCYV
ncbi:hypothetical protein SK128_014929 [Halocaridina rubra]|uniref:Uncharacterized protein n=1 Tax=Halocaridina rubra TaxID=373956 RepID=A0AAN9ABS7_HALRR